MAATTASADGSAAAHQPRDVELFVGFARAARAAGLKVTPSVTTDYLHAVSLVGAQQRDAVYWAGRATLCCTPEDLPRYEALFDAWFGDRQESELRRRTTQLKPVLTPRDDEQSGTTDQDPDDVIRAAASDVELLRQRDIASLSAVERQFLARLFGALQPPHPRRLAARRRRSRMGSLDARGTVRASMRNLGEPARLRFERRTTRPRSVVLLIDVSGSMKPYADALIRLAHVWVRGSERVEVFTMGTRLTRITRSLQLADPDAAIRSAASEVPDFSGGTRLAESLSAFLRTWGRRSMARRSTVVIFSDGWERGDCRMLSDQMRLMRKLAHRMVWANPHRGKAGYAPVQSGIVAALPYCDDLISGHSLQAFAEIMAWVQRES